MSSVRRASRPALAIAAALVVIATAPATAGGLEPREGEYAGNARKAAVFFRVAFGDADDAIVRAELPGCDVNLFIDDVSEIDRRGRFSLFSPQTDGGARLAGRFVSPAKVRGQIRIAISESQSGCEDGIYKLDYSAKRVSG